MATRLEITHGLIAERDRLSTSADSLSVTRPTTGSKTRSKGVLFVLVGSTLPGPRAREATLLVADTIRREYYYDESAGVPVCLEKAVKSADRKLRSSREGAGMPPGVLGIAAAVIRNAELYLATIGPVEAYLIRSARLLMPDRSAPAGLPSDDSLSVDVWRGELNVGDALVLVSGNLSAAVGSEELKSAVLTLHPQAAVEHLHHLFVAAGGEGSDGIIAVEASEQTSRVTSSTVPAMAGDAYGDLPGMMPDPVGSAVGSTLLGARGAILSSIDNARYRLWEAMPRRRTRAYGLSPRTSRAEAQRRAAMGLLALVGVVFILGLFVILGPRGGDATEITQVASGDSALSVALDRTDRADNLVGTEDAAALGYYREAWEQVEHARETGLSAPALDALETRVIAGLDGLYDAHRPITRKIADLPPGADPFGLTRGPRNGAYYIDRAAATVSRVNMKNGSITDVVHEGDKPASGGKQNISTPVQVEAGGPDVVVVDDNARAWRWRPSNNKGRGTLAKLTFLGGTQWGEDHGDVGTYSSPSGGYRLYVIEPTQGQVLRYQQTFDGSSFQAPSGYLVTKSDQVGDFKQLHIDSDLYALVGNELQKYSFGRYQGTFSIDDPPDVDDIRPTRDYELVAGAGSSSTGGRAYLYDADWGRVVGFSKADGSYLGQWIPGPDQPKMDDVRGMYLIPGKGNKRTRNPDTLVWITPDGLYESILVVDGSTTPPDPAPAKKKKQKKNG